jgi:hypothetical protein
MRSSGKISYGGVTIAITGIMLLIAIPLMFAFLFYFIDKIWGAILFVIGITVLVIFVAALLGGNTRGYRFR